MSQLIQPILDGFKTLLIASGATGALPVFGKVAIMPSNGVLASPPQAWVSPGRTQFPNQGEGNMRNEAHAVTIRLGISGTDPEELTTRTVAYVQAVDAAIAAFTGWPNYVLRVFVSEHDYGPMYAKGGLAYFPDLHCVVSVEEVS
jgi:hypothetical protein